MQDPESIHTDPVQQPEKEINPDAVSNDEPISKEQELENQIIEQKDKFLRLFAEFDNYKKRMAKDKLDYMSTAGKDIVLEMLPVLDDFERAMNSFKNSEDLSAIKEGLALIYDKMSKTFERKGIKKIEAKGLPFDTEKHEAITEIPVTEEAQKGLVIDEVESGYTMHEKIIRFSKVVVGK